MRHLHYNRADFSRRRGTFVYSAIGWGAAALITYASVSAYSGGQEAKHQRGVQKDKEAANKRLMEKLTAGPAAPTPDDSKEKAKAEMDKQKRIKQLAGGKTLLSSESPILSSTTTGSKTLLGA